MAGSTKNKANSAFSSVPAEKAKSKQSTLPLLTGPECIAYLLVKEMAWEAVEAAFCMKEVATWEEWDVLECDDTMAQAEVWVA